MSVQFIERGVQFYTKQQKLKRINKNHLPRKYSLLPFVLRKKNGNYELNSKKRVKKYFVALNAKKDLQSKKFFGPGWPGPSKSGPARPGPGPKNFSGLRPGVKKIFPARPGPARSPTKNFRPSPARPGRRGALEDTFTNSVYFYLYFVLWLPS